MASRVPWCPLWTGQSCRTCDWALEAYPEPPPSPTHCQGGLCPRWEGGCRKESLGPSSSRRGGMSCRPSRDFPSLSNKIPGEQAAGFGRAPAGDPPSPARTPGSPRPSSNGFPGELRGPQLSSLQLPGPVGKPDPLPSNQRWLPSPHPPGKPPPFLWPP